MRFCIIFSVTLGLFSLSFAATCHAEAASESGQTKPLAKADAVPKSKRATVAKLGESKKRFAPLGSPDSKPAAATLGKPKFMLRNATPMAANVGGNAQDRAAEAKRLIDAYEGIALRYSDGLVLAETAEAKEALAGRAPSARALRPIAVLMAHLVTVNPKDEPALDVMVFLSKFVEVPEIDAVLSGESSKRTNTQFDLHAELLEHHANHDKIINACRRLPRGEQTDIFLHQLVDTTFNPAVRWAAGAQLFASHRRNNRSEAMEQLAVLLSEDRYLEGVIAGRKLSARQWAANKLREIRTLGIGQTLPDVSGEKLAGGTGNITDYRGKVVVLDVWTTWCGPCRAMIPHEVEMAQRLKDRPFAMLSVSCDKDRETLEEYLEETSMPWDHWWVAPDSEFKKVLNISAYPTIFVLDAQGVIRYKNVKDEQLDSAVETLLQEIERS